MSCKNNNISDSKDREIRLTREFDAPRELVFKTFMNPRYIGQWWGPDGFSTTTESMNFKVGGEWIFTMHGPDGTDYPNHVVYTDIKKPEYLKYDHYGHKDQEGDSPHFKATITFEDLGDQTKIKQRSNKDQNANAFPHIQGTK